MSKYRVFCYVIFLLFLNNDIDAEWVLQNPSITPQQHRCIFFIDPSTGWIGGSAGSIFKTTDSGKTWSQQNTPKNNWVYSVHFTDQNHGWAVGSFCILFTENGGVVWTEKKIDMLSSRVAKKVYFKNAGEGYILLDSPLNNFATTQDSGNTWKFQTIGNSKLYDLQFTDEQHAFLCGENYIGRSIDGAETWIPADKFPHELSRIIQLQMLDSTTGYAQGEYGLCKTIDGGKTWLTKLYTSTPVPYHAVHFFDTLVGISMLGIDTMILFRTVDGGTTWDTIISTKLFKITAFTFPEKSEGICVAEDGAIYSIDHTGENIQNISQGNNSDVNSIDFYDSIHGYCDNGLYTSDGGRKWIKKSLIFTKFAVFDSNTILGSNGIDSVVYTTNAGLSWNLSPVEPTGIKEIQKIPGTRYSAYIQYNNNSIILTNDGGKTFSTCSPLEFRAYSAYFLNENMGWAVGGKVGFTNDGGRSWKTLSDSLPVDISTFSLRTVFFIDSLVGWIGGACTYFNGGASVDEDIILKTTDGGKSWVQQKNLKVREDFSYNPALGTGPHRILKIRSQDGRRVWAIDYISGVLFSDDGGEHWEEMYLPCNNQRFTDLFFIDDNNIWVTAKNSGIWKYSNTALNKVVDKKDKSSLKPKGMVYFKNAKLMLNNQMRGLIHFELFDLKGSIIRSYTFEKNNDETIVGVGNINIGNGMYLIKIKSGKKRIITQFTKIQD